MFFSILQFIQSWKRYNASLRELSQLGDRELADIGLARSDIPRVAGNRPISKVDRPPLGARARSIIASADMNHDAARNPRLHAHAPSRHRASSSLMIRIEHSDWCLMTSIVIRAVFSH